MRVRRWRQPAGWRWVLGAAVLFSFAVTARAQDDDDPLAAARTTKAAQPGKKSDPTAERIDFTAAVSPKEARRGQTVKLTITGTPRPGFHTYPLTERSADPAQDVSGLCKVTFEDTPGLKPLWPVTESESEFEEVKGVGVFLEHKRPFTWTQDVLVLPDATPGPKTLRFTIRAQACDDRTCVWGNRPLQAEVVVSGAPAEPLTPELQARLKEGPPPIKVVPVPAAVGGAPKIGPPDSGAGTAATGSPSSPAGQSLLGLLLVSMGAAVAMLFTPCVFPMIPITVSFFLKQSEKEHHNALLMAAVYSLTITVVLAAAVLLLGERIIAWANAPWLNLGLGLLLVLFALSLFGMYELELPSGLARFTAAREGRGGYVGALFMALTFTITSFTCTGPFLGPLLVATREFQVGFQRLVLGALVYAATFAAPFFVLALFPRLLKTLPKSGSWLNSVKVVMGFLELAAALKFLANTDLAWNPGNPTLFNYETVLCAWVALSVACGFYLFGVFRLPHDTPQEHVGVVRMLLGALFLGLAIYMTPALWGVTPQGAVGKGLVAFLPLDTRARAEAPAAGGRAELNWHRNYQEAWERATREGKLIFIDFTGQNCTNCRYNEKNIFPRQAVHDELARYVRVQLYTDFVPDPGLSRAESARQGQRNQELQSGTFGDIANPLYAIIRPAKDSPVETKPDGKERLKGEVLGVRTGLIKDNQIPDFEQFLAEPQRQAARVEQAAAPGT